MMGRLFKAGQLGITEKASAGRIGMVLYVIGVFGWFCICVIGVFEVASIGHHDKTKSAVTKYFAYELVRFFSFSLLSFRIILLLSFHFILLLSLY